MATLLMNLRNVPEDEADEVRALFNGHHIDFYETPASKWGLFAGGIWLRDDRQVDQARQLLADYQRDRLQRAREEHEALVRSGEAETIYTRFRREPVRFAVYLALIGFVLTLSMTPLYMLWRG